MGERIAYHVVGAYIAMLLAFAELFHWLTKQLMDRAGELNEWHCEVEERMESNGK